MKSLSRVRLFATPWTVAHQASQSMGFSRQEYWSGLPFPSPTHLLWGRKESGKWKVKSLSHVRLFVTPWTAAYQASQSMGFSRQEHWSGLSFPSPKHMTDLGKFSKWMTWRHVSKVWTSSGENFWKMFLKKITDNNYKMWLNFLNSSEYNKIF